MMILTLLLLAAQNPDRWEKAITAFEQRDRQTPPPQEAVLFVGSSSIRMWKLETSFPDLDAINRGFGGSKIADSTRYADRIVLPHRPRVVVLYAGDNDVASGMTPDEVFRDYLAFVKKVHAALPETRIVYLPIKPSVKRWALWPKMKEANGRIAEHAATDDRLEYADTAAPMLATGAPPATDLFLKDGLHLSEKGYAMWAEVLRPYLDAGKAEIRLLVRSDDMGASHGITAGCLESCVNGIARSIEVIVPGPWFPETVKRLKEHPEIDVGVHLCLTSEWENVKWGPVTRAPSLADARGYFHPMTRQRKDFPPKTGFLDAEPKLEEVEAELRAQIETAKRLLPNVTHLSAHMGAATASPALRELTETLSKEYGLPMSLPGLKRMRGVWKRGMTGPERAEAMARAIRELGPGTWMFVEHPATDGPEMRAIGHKGYEDVAADRAAVLHALTSDAVKAAVRERGVKLVSYADVLGD